MTQSKRAGEWLIKEGSVPGTNVYKLLQGKVSVYEGDQKIKTIEVAEDMEPKLIGVIAALSNSRDRTASVCADSEITFETISIDQIKNALKKDVPQNIMEDVNAIIKAITMRDEIKRLQNIVAQLSLPEKLEIPENVNPETKAVLSELKDIYESSH